MTIKFLSQLFYENYETYKESSINNRRFTHTQLKQVVEKLKSNNKFKITCIGKSLENRDIYLIRIGTGDTKVFAWSQMHGDEATATMSLFDIFNFLCGDDEFNNLRNEILQNVTLYFIPMLNPDGAEKFKRTNSLNIDLNRDALRLQSPESQILKKVRDEINPQFGFNLHDQNIRYSSGHSYRNATISLLAPPFNYEKDINNIRANTMKLAVNIYEELSKFIPGHVGKWNDDFEPRAFGDNFVKWGTSSLLIESGGWKNDEEKQFIRKLNFVALLTGFQSIAYSIYAAADINTYFTIPENDKYIFNILFRNLTLNYKNQNFIIDIGINKEEKNINNSRDFYIESIIEDMGDLSTFFGMEEYDCTGLTVVEGNIYEKEFSSIEEIEKLDFEKLLSDGFVAVKLKSQKSPFKFTPLPINIIYNNSEFDTEIAPENGANFIIKREGVVEYAVINGFIFNYQSSLSKIRNGLVIK